MNGDSRRWGWAAVGAAFVVALGLLVATDGGAPAPDGSASTTVPILDADATEAARQVCLNEAATINIRSVSETTTGDGATYTVQMFSEEALLATCVVRETDGDSFELVSLTPS
jgi:hypothetical protein